MIETTASGFVAGATGLTGRSVIAELRARGIESVAHVRPDSSALERWRERFTSLGADVDTTPWEEGALTDTLRRRAPTLVFALLGTTRKRGKLAASQGRDPAAESYEAVDYGLTAMLRRAAEASGHRPRFVYLSAMLVREGTKSPYYAARARIERELAEGALPYTIVRPGFIVGERDDERSGESIGAAISDAALSIAGLFGARTLRERYRSIRGDDLAKALVRLGLDESAENRTFESEALR